MSQHSHDSVILWLKSVSSSENTPAGRKRKRLPLVKRRPNTMTFLPTRTPSPSKRQRVIETNSDGDSVENTPQPWRPVQSTRVSVSQKSSSSTCSSVASSKSRSPTKQMSEMRFAPQPIIFKHFVPRTSGDLPAELNTLLQTIELRFSRGIAVISYAHKTEIAEVTVNAFDAIDDFAFTQSSTLPGPSPTPEQCAKAVWLAQRCEDGRCSEAAWNSSVHNFVFDLAIHHAEFLKNVYFLNCTSAKISLSSLIPPGQASTALNSKMINFAIHIEPSDRFETAIHERAQLSAMPMSVNHTLYDPLRWRPIGVSIETKHTGQNWDDAMAQVGIWTAAQFTKLEELIKEADEILGGRGTLRDGPEVPFPFLPIIIIQGHDWHFLTAIRIPHKQTCIYHKVTFGSTSSLRGVYQVVTTIQLLVCWVRDSFTKWFERYCFNLTEDTVLDTAPFTAFVGV